MSVMGITIVYILIAIATFVAACKWEYKCDGDGATFAYLIPWSCFWPALLLVLFLFELFSGFENAGKYIDKRIREAFQKGDKNEK